MYSVRGDAIVAINCTPHYNTSMMRVLAYWSICGKRDEESASPQRFAPMNFKSRAWTRLKQTKSWAIRWIFVSTASAPKYCSTWECAIFNSSQIIQKRWSVLKDTVSILSSNSQSKPWQIRTMQDTSRLSGRRWGICFRQRSSGVAGVQELQELNLTCYVIVSISTKWQNQQNQRKHSKT